MKWISVKDRLPIHSDFYIVANSKTGRSGYAEWITENSRWYEDRAGYLDKYVTHWMPLPEPPKE